MLGCAEHEGHNICQILLEWIAVLGLSYLQSNCQFLHFEQKKKNEKILNKEKRKKTF